MDKEKTEKVLEELKKEICKWPGCKEKMQMVVSLPSLRGGEESGTFEAEKDVAIGCPFCMYHSLIAGNGHFGVIKLESNKLQLHGSFPLVEMIESVMAARETTKIVQPKTREDVVKLMKDKKEKAKLK